MTEQLIKDYLYEYYQDFIYDSHSENIDGQGFSYVDVKCDIGGEFIYVHVEMLTLIAFVYSKINK